MKVFEVGHPKAYDLHFLLVLEVLDLLDYSLEDCFPYLREVLDLLHYSLEDCFPDPREVLVKHSQRASCFLGYLSEVLDLFHYSLEVMEVLVLLDCFPGNYSLDLDFPSENHSLHQVEGLRRGEGG